MMSRPAADRVTTPKLAVIGCGPIGTLHAEAICHSPAGSLVAVCDLDDERRNRTAQRFAARPYAVAAEMFAKEPLDAVTIATPDHLHVEVALAAIAARCHVFCEKPLASSVADAQRLVAAATERGVLLAVDYNRRFAFGYRTTRRLLDDHRIGKLNTCLLRVSDGTPRAEVARNPHVMFTTLLTHHFDLVRHYGGEIARLQAHAAGDSSEGLLRNVTIWLVLASGASATIVASYREGQTHTSEWMELGGASGTIVVEDITRRVTLSGVDPARTESFEPDRFDSGGAFYDSLVEHVQIFVEHIARGKEPPVTGRDGLVGMKLAAAAVESLVSGKAIEV